jgi:hypothetical protein
MVPRLLLQNVHFLVVVSDLIVVRNNVIVPGLIVILDQVLDTSKDSLLLQVRF